jgi:hypothetical protein
LRRGRPRRRPSILHLVRAFVGRPRRTYLHRPSLPPEPYDHPTSRRDPAEDLRG